MSFLRKFFKSKSAIALATATGALSFHAYAPHSLSLPPDFNLAHAGCDGVEAVIDAVVRSSRAISTVPFFFLCTSSTSLSLSLSLLCLPRGLKESCCRLLSPLQTTSTLFMACRGIRTSIDVNYPRSLFRHFWICTSFDAAERERVILLSEKAAYGSLLRFVLMLLENVC